MMEIFVWIEQSPLSLWIATAYFAFPIILTFHSLGMGFLVGVFLLINLRILGLARGVPLVSLQGFLPLTAWSFIIVLLSGLLLLAAYPAKALTNPLFYWKMLMMGLAFYLGRVLTVKVLRQPMADQGLVAVRYKILAAGSLLLWAGVIGAGRFLAYTYNILLASDIY